MQLSPFNLDGAEKLKTALRTPGPAPLVIETTSDSFQTMLGALYSVHSDHAEKIALKLRISSAAVTKPWGGTVIRFFLSEDDAESYLRLVASSTATKAIRQDLKDRLFDRVEQRDEEAVS